MTLQASHSGQRVVEAGRKRFTVLACGRRWGKTKWGIKEAALCLLERRKDVLWLGPNTDLHTLAWEEAKERLHPITTRVREQDHRLRTIAGTTLHFGSLHADAKKGRSMDVGLAIYDEAAYVKPKDRLGESINLAVMPALIESDGELILCSSPSGKDHDFYEFYQRGLTGDPDWASFQMPTSTNPYITPNRLALLMRGMTPHGIRQEIEAEFLDTHGVYVQRDWFDNRYDVLPNLKRWVRAYDPAFTEDGDWTASMLGGINERGEILVADVQRVRTQAPDVRQLILDNVKRDPPGTAVILETAHSGLAIFQDLRRDPTFLRTPLLDYKPAGRDKLQRAAGWLAAASQGRIRLPAHAPWVEPYLSELLDFRNDPKTDVDDQWDATTVLFEGLYQTAGRTHEETEIIPGTIGEQRALEEAARRDWQRKHRHARR